MPYLRARSLAPSFKFLNRMRHFQRVQSYLTFFVRQLNWSVHIRSALNTPKLNFPLYGNLLPPLFHVPSSANPAKKQKAKKIYGGLCMPSTTTLPQTSSTFSERFPLLPTSIHPLPTPSLVVRTHHLPFSSEPPCRIKPISQPPTSSRLCCTYEDLTLFRSPLPPTCAEPHRVMPLTQFSLLPGLHQLP